LDEERTENTIHGRNRVGGHVHCTVALLTAVWPDWIETLLGIDPDRHIGSLEWSIVIGLTAVAATFWALARLEWLRMLRRA
jgi:hypothetical protein